MTLNYRPDAGEVLICDFSGLREPEMIKHRPVVVVSPRRRRGPAVVTIVPFSTTAPIPVENYHVAIDSRFLPGKLQGVEIWAKCDMVYALSIRRLDRILIGKRPDGSRTYLGGRVTTADLQSIRNGIAIALGISES